MKNLARQGPSEVTSHAVKIDVRLSVLKDTIVSGEAVQLSVEIWNRGSSDVFVCKDFDKSSWPLCSLRLSVQDSAGTYGAQQGSAVDFDFWKKDPLETVLMRDWIALRPEHFYGTLVQMEPDSYPPLRGPGRYQILAEYTSHGLVRGYQGTVSIKPEEMANLPAKTWQGTVDSNIVTVRVIPNKR